MAIPLVVALLLHPSFHFAAKIGPNQEYEEPAAIQAIPGYHPLLRFKQSSSFVFQAKYMTADGHYTKQGNHYDFRPETVEMMNHADLDKIVPMLPGERAQDLIKKYNLTMAPFSADYDPSSGELHLSCSPDGLPASFDLYDYTAGDAGLATMVNDAEKPLIGLWGQIDPFPEKMDSKTRFRIEGIDGLVRFSAEASGSDHAEFNLYDIRSDGSFRYHDKEGRWQRNDATVRFTAPKFDVTFQISRDLTKLFSGKTVLKR